MLIFHSSRPNFLSGTIEEDASKALEKQRRVKDAIVRLSVWTAIQGPLGHIECELRCYQEMCNDEVLRAIRLGPTKLGAIVKHVIAPEILCEISGSVGPNRYSLLLDGSNLFSEAGKYIGAVIRYTEKSFFLLFRHV